VSDLPTVFRIPQRRLFDYLLCIIGVISLFYWLPETNWLDLREILVRAALMSFFLFLFVRIAILVLAFGEPIYVDQNGIEYRQLSKVTSIPWSHIVSIDLFRPSPPTHWFSRAFHNIVGTKMVAILYKASPSQETQEIRLTGAYDPGAISIVATLRRFHFELGPTQSTQETQVKVQYLGSKFFQQFNSQNLKKTLHARPALAALLAFMFSMLFTVGIFIYLAFPYLAKWVKEYFLITDSF